MIPHVLSNITEDIVRLTLILILLPVIIPYGIKYSVCFLVLSNIISEISSTIVLLAFLPKNININKKDIKINKIYLKDSLRIGIPNTISRLIGSIGYFFEPIILTNTLIKVGYPQAFITKEYGIISGYVIPLILLPSFFTTAISQALLPVLSKEYIKGNKNNTKRKLILAITISLLIGIPYTIFLTIKPEFLLKLIYNTNEGINYIKLLAPICIMHYIQSPLSTTLDAINKSKDNLYASILGTITRTSLLYILSYFKIGLYNLIISTSINIVVITIYETLKIKKYLK